MHKLKRKPEVLEHPTDAAKIVEAMARRGFEISEADAEWAWQQHSDNWCASWLLVDDSDEAIAAYILDHMEIYE